MDIFEVEFFMKYHVFMEWTPFIGENYNAKERKQMSNCCTDSGKNSWVYLESK